MKNILSKVLRYLPNNKRVKSKDVKSLLITLGIYIGIAFVLAIVKTILRNIPLIGNLVYNIGSIYRIYSWVGAIIAAIQCFGNDDYSEVEYITFDEIKNLKSLWESRNVKIAMIVCLAALCLIPNGNKPKTFSSSDEKDSVASADTNEVKEAEKVETDDKKVEEKEEVTEEVSEISEQEELVEEVSSNYRTEMSVSVRPEKVYNKICIEENVYDKDDVLRVKYQYSEDGDLDRIYLYDDNESLIQSYSCSGGEPTTNYVYDSRGNCIEEYTFTSEGERHMENFYEYDSEDKLVHIIENHRDGYIQYDEKGKVIMEEMPFYAIFYEYDSDGNLLKGVKYNNSNQDKCEGIYLYEYDEDKNISKELFYNMNDELETMKAYKEEECITSLKYMDGTIASGYESILDDKGNICELLLYTDSEVYNNTKIVYDGDGNIIQTIRKVAARDEKNEVHTFEYGGKNKIDIITYQSEDEKQSEILFDYLSSGCDKIICTDNFNFSSKINVEYQYNENGMLTNIVIHGIREDNEVEVLREQEFTYNADGILNSVTTTEGDDIEVLNFE